MNQTKLTVDQRILHEYRDMNDTMELTASPNDEPSPSLLPRVTMASLSHQHRPRLPLPAPLRNHGKPSQQQPAPRARSLSRVFNYVPVDRPVVGQAQVDVLEYYCHLCCLQQTSRRQVQDERAHLTQALMALQSPLRRYGRLWSRLQIASLSISVASLLYDMTNTESPDAMEEDDDDVLLQTFLDNPLQWNELIQQFQTVQQYLLRRDANCDVPLEEEAEEPPPENPRLDRDLQQHVMFQADANEVLQLLHVQSITAKFRNDLQLRLQQQLGNNLHHEMIEVGDILQSYRTSLAQLFGGQQHIPPQLTSFVPKKTNRSLAQLQENVAHKMIEDCWAVVRGGSATFSIHTAQQKTRDLLLKWSESILTIPTLVRLGYGGVRAPIVAEHDEAHDNDDVSSYGVDAELDELDASASSHKRNHHPHRSGPKTCSTSDERFGIQRRTNHHHNPEDNDDEKEEEEQHNANDDDDDCVPSSRGSTTIERQRPEKRPRRRSSLESTRTASTSKTSSNEEQEQLDHPLPVSALGTDCRDDSNSNSSFILQPNQSNNNSTPTNVHTASTLPRKAAKSNGQLSPGVQSSLHRPSPPAGRLIVSANGRSQVVPSGPPSTEKAGGTVSSPLQVHVDGNRNDQSSSSSSVSPLPSDEILPDDEDSRMEALLWRDDPSSSSTIKGPHRKVGWTVEESEAVRDGYARWGPRWRMIKDNCGGKLCRRTNVQIKDKFRTMVSRGEIQIDQPPQQQDDSHSG